MSKSKAKTVYVITHAVITGERIASYEAMETFNDFVRLRAALVSNYRDATINGFEVVRRGDMPLFMFNQEKDVFAHLQGDITEEELQKCIKN